MSTEDHGAIAALQSRYADVVSRQAFAELHELFVADIGSSGDTATGRMWFHELHQDREQHRLLHLYGWYRDEFARIEGRWWFVHRRFAPLAMTSKDPDRDLDVFPNRLLDGE